MNPSKDIVFQLVVDKVYSSVPFLLAVSHWPNRINISPDESQGYILVSCPSRRRHTF